MLLEALLAVDGATLSGLEGDFGLLPTVRAGDLGHLSGAAVISTAPSSVIQYFHSFSFGYTRNIRVDIPRIRSVGWKTYY